MQRATWLSPRSARTPAPAALATGPGGNVFSAHGVLSGRRRFSTYTVRSQAGMFQTGGAVENNIEGHGADPSVPLFRPMGRHRRERIID